MILKEEIKTVEAADGMGFIHAEKWPKIVKDYA